jgi:hypothetical protein
MRVYGRVTLRDGSLAWQVVQTAANGDNSAVYLTWLIQCLKLNLNESPMFATWGIPAYQSVRQQIPPDVYVQLMQQRFAPYFASLIITRTADSPVVYQATVLTKYGAVLTASTAGTSQIPG